MSIICKRITTYMYISSRGEAKQLMTCIGKRTLCTYPVVGDSEADQYTYIHDPVD